MLTIADDTKLLKISGASAMHNRMQQMQQHSM